ncbi:MAG: hypothetical protein MK171_01815 [Pirellulales bacterium]|nr:hypothetical protein [Pirellulales bacterium]
MYVPCHLYRSICWTTCFFLVIAGGCQQQVVSKLRGQWIGRADTAEAQEARDNKKYGKSRVANPAMGSQKIEGRKTDWEMWEDVAVIWDFSSGSDLKMSLADGSQSISGRWSIVDTGPTGSTIEVLTGDGIASEGARPDGAQRPETEACVIRRFEIELDERDGECVGFLLYEVAADRQLGALYFRRPIDAD